ncbi:hypothetical protein [Bradyrhizobium sp. S69]|uniref:hypothetical protein n=1 Tax=Bradyrhizobium sp. S69 TaxID=1641856 RepID=UPI00131B511F|nr:hypothetical protein [Bradyrhizobium sp. S69]
MKIVKIIVPLALLVFLIGHTKEFRLLMNEGGWPGLAVVLICFGGILMCYGVALMPIASKVRAPPRLATYVANDVAAPMKKLRNVPPRYRVAALVCGGMSLFLFGVVFAMLRQAYHVAVSSAWSVWVVAALIVLVAAVGAFFALLAWGALSDPKSRLGSRFREKSADAAQYLLLNVAFESLMWVGFGLVVWAAHYSVYLGVAVFLCLVLLLLVIMRRELKSDIEALDDPNDNPRANQLIGRSREPGSYDYRD